MGRLSPLTFQIPLRHNGQLQEHVGSLGNLGNGETLATRLFKLFLIVLLLGDTHFPSMGLPFGVEVFSEASFRTLVFTEHATSYNKVSLLVEITSVRMTGELGALLVYPPFLSIANDSVSLYPDPSFLPTIASTFHNSQNFVLPVIYSLFLQKRNFFTPYMLRGR